MQKRYPKVKFIAMDAEKLDFKNNMFDEIYAIDVLEHVDRLQLVLSEIIRVLKVGGRLKVNIPHYNTEAWLLKLRPTYFKEIHHVRVFKENELEKILMKKNMSLKKKLQQRFLQHVELYFLFKRKVNSKNQLSIGSWRDSYTTKAVHAFMILFDKTVLDTPLKYFPVWVVTIPLGYFINFFGNMFLPTSLYYEFKKNEK